MAHRLIFNQSSETVDVIEPHSAKRLRFRVLSAEEEIKNGHINLARGRMVRRYVIREWITCEEARATLEVSDSQ